MIKINLLPQNEQKKYKGGAAAPKIGSGSMIIVAAAILMLAINGGAGWMAFRSVMTAKQGLDEVQSRYDSINAEITKKMSSADAVRKYREVVTNQMDVLKSLDPSDRILWSEKLNMLSNLVPSDVFLTEIVVNEQTKMVETEASKAARAKWEKDTREKKGKQPEQVLKPIITYKMTLTGLALGKDNVEQFNNVLRLQKALTTYSMKDNKGKAHRFMDGFIPNVEFGPIEASTYEGTPVNHFVFILNTMTQGTEELRKPAEPDTKRMASSRADAVLAQINQ